MEKLIRPYDKECMKMAMLKHEETFKEQVHELHRLYRIQKLLMKTIGSGVPNGGSPFNLAGQIDRTDCKPREGVDLERPARDSNAMSEGISALDTIEESQIELTLGPSSYHTSTSRSKKADTQLTSSSFSSSSTGSSGNIINSKPSRLRAGAGVEEEQLLKSERLNHQPWIFQALSLNST
ncbi:uncharacterized protein LOC116209637 [Punica granatum]|uniref:MYB-CC type transcription factor LHEQLE-containing domain-containing protein n=2 Tax=Punica granatum TaxID=22663 RepID=A0A218XCL6_PUNGR|nr:uncharacterized protein LOC116209637 [Punica granatum]XP_031399199.1 uncharacterized protein LOC116209637 [Punica granatum]OWM82112.1 hypothetical protein CDL15_Pgr001686 [Punica granatum]PKI44907.1 hypothetical protein CRG98_034855 [Punica granatum]